MRLYLIVSSNMQGLQQQQKHRERALSLKRFRTTSLPTAYPLEDCNTIIHQAMETVAHELHRNRHAAVQALVVVRQCVSQGAQLQDFLPLVLSWLILQHAYECSLSSAVLSVSRLSADLEGALDMQLLSQRVIPALVRVLLIRCSLLTPCACVPSSRLLATHHALAVLLGQSSVTHTCPDTQAPHPPGSGGCAGGGLDLHQPGVRRR